MSAIILLLVVGLLGVTALPQTKQMRIIGGNEAVITQYPSTVALLFSSDANNYYQACVGTILTTKSIVTAASCLQGDEVAKWRVRAGSNWANSGGIVYTLKSMLIHPKFNRQSMDSDIAIVRTTNYIAYSNFVRPASIASVNYNLPDNQVVWAVGFGNKVAGNSEKLRRLQIWTTNQTICALSYGVLGYNVTSNMLCAGSQVHLPAGSAGQCAGDSGSPLFHQGNLVGLYSWGFSCVSYPGVNTRISRFTAWIQNNA